MEAYENSKIITHEDCTKILQKYDSQNALALVEYELMKTDDSVIGYLGDYFNLRIYFVKRTNNSEHADAIMCFVKSMPIFNKSNRLFVQECGIFEKESFIYENILPKLTNIIGFNIAPKYFLIKDGIIVLEDLKVRHFAIQKDNLTLQQCQLLVKCLAYFHSATIIYEEKNSINKMFRFGDEYKGKFVEGSFSFIQDDPKYMSLKTVADCIIEFWKTIPGFNDKKLFQKFKDVLFDGKFENFIQSSKSFRNVLTHNDLWCNNIMFNNNLECIILDFQNLRYTPPAYDLLMALYFNNCSELLSQNFDSLLEHYYTVFSCQLRKNNINPDVVFSKTDFLNSIEVYKLPALLEATICANTVFLPEDRYIYIMKDEDRYQDFTFGSRSKYNIDCFKSDKYFREKHMSLLLPLADLLLNVPAI